MRGRILPAAICVGFALIGIPMIIIGPSDVRLMGAMSVLFFGGGGLALLLPLMSRRGAGTVRIADVGMERGFLFPVGRAKQIVVLFAAASMTAASALLFVFGERIAAVAGVAVFGAFTVYAAAGVPRPRGLALTPTRVVVLGAAAGELPWEAVAWADVYEDGTARFLGISATDSAQVRRGSTGWFARLNVRLTPADLVVPADHLTGTPDVAVKAIRKYLNHPARRAEIGTQVELERLTA